MIGERLKQLRIKNGLKQQELANMFGLSSGTISFYESEQRKPDIDFIVAVAKYFDVSTDYLLGLTNATDKENIDITLHKDISKVTGLNDFSLTILEQSLKETNNAAAEVIDTVICGGDFLRFVNLINDKKEKKPTIDIDWSDICDKKLSDIFDMDIEQRTTILNMLFPMNRFNACELRELEIEKYIDSIAKRLKEKYLNLVKSADELMG